MDNKTPDCGEWLKDNNLERLEITNTVLQEAMRIKGLLGIVGDNYHAKGVGENDLLIIATARTQGVELVSNEAIQKIRPDIPAKRKIPAVCAMPEVSFSCINFLEFIRKSEQVFR